MSGCEDFGPWIEHHGRGVPPGIIGCFIEGEWESPVDRCLKREAGLVRADYPETIGATAWDHSLFETVVDGYMPGRVLRYRIRKPRGLRELREMVEALPVPEGVA